MRSWIKICLTSASLSVYTFKSHEIDVGVSKHVLLKIEQSIGPYYPIGSNPWFCIFSVTLLKTTLLTAIYRYNWIHHLSITHLCPTLWPFCNENYPKMLTIKEQLMTCLMVYQTSFFIVVQRNHNDVKLMKFLCFIVKSPNLKSALWIFMTLIQRQLTSIKSIYTYVVFSTNYNIVIHP